MGLKSPQVEAVVIDRESGEHVRQPVSDVHPTFENEPPFTGDIKEAALGTLRFSHSFEGAEDIGVPEQMREVEQFYEAISILGEGEGMAHSHALFLETLYSHRYLPLLRTLFADSKKLEEIVRVNKGLAALKEVMVMVQRHEDSESVSTAQAFLGLYDQALDGENDFLVKVKKARDEAVQCIRDLRDVFVSEESCAEADIALLERLESEAGIQLPAEFSERLVDQNTRALVVSLDFNSTFNFDESYPSAELVARGQRALKKFARDFRRTFSEKELFLSINTGRPGQYAWGAVEAAFAPIPEVRKVAVAECGGVVLKEGLKSGAMEVAVEHPHEWKTELDYIRSHFLEQIVQPQTVAIEEKLSMLSIRLAEDDSFVLRSKDGQCITPDWIQRQLQEYFLKTEKELGEKFSELMDDVSIDIPHMAEYTRRAIQALGVESVRPGGLNGGKRKALIELEHLVDAVTEEHLTRLEEIKARLKTIDLMYDQALLQADYNPTAGYIDIGHAHLNKYSTLMKHVCDTQDLTPDQVLYLQLGDSTTDIIPEDLMGIGEPNEAADKALLVAVKNCNQKLRAAVERRGERGLMTARPSILGAEALFKGLRRAVVEVR